MDYADYYSGLDRDCYRDLFPHSLLGTRGSSFGFRVWGLGGLGCGI